MATATYEFFKFVTNLDDLKSQYRQLCKVHHPDLGGDLKAMQAINAEYDRRLKSGIFNSEFESKKSSFELEKEIREMAEKVMGLKKVTAEVCGKWVWVSGETWRYKKVFKSLGFFWASKKAMWYWRKEENSAGGHRSVPMDKIRAKYGSQVFKEDRPGLSC